MTEQSNSRPRQVDVDRAVAASKDGAGNVVRGTKKDVQWPPLGSWWRENDYRGGTVPKQVVAHNQKNGKVGIKGVMLTWAKVERFNGKTGGYSRVEGKYVS